MVELKLVGIHDDGEHLIFVDPEQREYRVVVDEPLRAAVRRDRAQLEQLRTSDIRPRDIQALIRAGASSADIAEQAGISIEQVSRYEGPVLAERGFVAARAQALRISREPDAPTLGDLVVDRLAARNITELTWDAHRPGNDPWQVVATYVAGGQPQHAQWRVDLQTGHLHALDDEAKWLSEIDLAEAPYRHLSTVGDRFYDVDADGGLPPGVGEDPAVEDVAGEDTGWDSREHAPEDETATILAELDAARGVRQPLEAAEDTTLWEDPPAAHPPLSRPQDATDATVLDLPERAHSGAGDGDEPEPEPATPRRRNRNRRTSVPSWDEIVFGAKSD